MNANVLITGANGNIGRKLLVNLLNNTSAAIYAVASSEEKVYSALDAEGVKNTERIFAVKSDEFLSESWDNIFDFDAVHLAFSRRNKPNEDIADSIDYSDKVFKKLKKLNANRVINLSSQGVYGNCREIRTESTKPAPSSQYTMAKYASEKIFNIYFSDMPGSAANIRLDSVVQSQNLVQALCRQAKYDGLIKLKGGDQCFSYIDINDAASALLALLKYDGRWNNVYNVGLNNGRITLLELAGKIADYSRKSSGNAVKIDLDRQPTDIWAGMDASSFMKDTGWTPMYSIEDMIAHMYENV